MHTFWIILLSAIGLYLLILIFSAILLRVAIAYKPIIDLSKDKIIRRTEWGIHIPKLVESIEKLSVMQKERIIRKSFDGLNLVAYFIPCPQNPQSRKFALLMHGYASCGKNDFAVGVEYFTQLGYNVLLPDQRAHGESEGKYIGFGILERYDCKMWAETLIERFGDDIQIILGGMSMGATTVLMASELDLPKAVKCIYADCGFTEPIKELKHILRKILHIPGLTLINGAGIMTKRLAKYNIKERSTIDALRNAKKPILFIHGKADKLVPYHFSEENYEACISEKKLLLVEGGMHGTSYFADNEKYKNTVEEFIGKHVE